MAFRSSWVWIVGIFVALSIFRVCYYWIDPYNRGLWNIVYAVIVPLLCFAAIYEGYNRPKLIYTLLMIFGVMGDNLHEDGPVTRVFSEIIMVSGQMLSNIVYGRSEPVIFVQFMYTEEFLMSSVETALITGWWLIMIWIGRTIIDMYYNLQTDDEKWGW